MYIGLIATFHLSAIKQSNTLWTISTILSDEDTKLWQLVVAHLVSSMIWWILIGRKPNVAGKDK